MTSQSRMRILNAAQRERAALHAWVKGGRKGDRPLTPALDMLAHEHELRRPPRGHEDSGRRGD